MNHVQKNSPSDIVSWLIEYQQSYSDEAFQKVYESHGYFQMKKLNTIQTVAMWTKSNASLTQCCIILCHLQIGLGYNVTVLESTIKDRDQPIFSVVKPKYGVYLSTTN